MIAYPFLFHIWALTCALSTNARKGYSMSCSCNFTVLSSCDPSIWSKCCRLTLWESRMFSFKEGGGGAKSLGTCDKYYVISDFNTILPWTHKSLLMELSSQSHRNQKNSPKNSTNESVKTVYPSDGFPKFSEGNFSRFSEIFQHFWKFTKGTSLMPSHSPKLGGTTHKPCQESTECEMRWGPLVSDVMIDDQLVLHSHILQRWKGLQG